MTLVRFFASMRPQVYYKGWPLTETFSAVRADMRFLFGVDSDVNFQVLRGKESLAAIFAGVGFLAPVSPHVQSEAVARRNVFATHLADLRECLSAKPQMVSIFTVVIKNLVTRFAVVLGGGGVRPNVTLIIYFIRVTFAADFTLVH